MHILHHRNFGRTKIENGSVQIRETLRGEAASFFSQNFGNGTDTGVLQNVFFVKLTILAVCLSVSDTGKPYADSRLFPRIYAIWYASYGLL